MGESDIDAYIDRWVFWCATRRLLAPTVKSNILSRLQPSKVRTREPVAFMDPSMPHFNMAVHALCEQVGQERTPRHSWASTGTGRTSRDWRGISNARVARSITELVVSRGGRCACARRSAKCMNQ